MHFNINSQVNMKAQALLAGNFVIRTTVGRVKQVVKLEHEQPKWA